MNVKKLSARLYAVTPGDFDAFQEYLDDRHNDGRQGPPPGRLVSETILAPKSVPDEMVDTDVDLSPALKNGVGQLVVIVEASPKPVNRWGA